MSDATIADLMQSVNTYKSGAEAATQQILSITGKQKDIADTSSAILDLKSTDDATVEAAKQAAALRTQSARVQSANTFHTNINDVSQEITKYAQQADNAQKAKDESIAEITRKDSVGLFDDPLEYIMNKFTINADIAKHNDANAALESANNRIQSMNANTQTTIMTQNAIAEPITAASAEAATRSAASAAALEANVMTEKGLAYNIQGIQAVQTASKEQLNNMFNLNTAKQAEAGQKIALAHLALSQKEFAFRQKEYEEKRADKQEQLDYAQSLVDTANRGRQAFGLEPMDDLSGKMLLATLKGKGPISSQMQLYLDAGERSKIAGVNVLGATPAQAIAALSTPVNLSPAQKTVKDLLVNSFKNVQDAIHAPPGAKIVDPSLAALQGTKDKEQIIQAVNIQAQAMLNGYARNINIGDATNPLNIGSLNVLASSSSKIQALPVYQKVLKPLADAGTDISDPKKILEWIGDAAAKGTITNDQAADGISTMFQEGVATNIATRNFAGLGGLIAPRTYNATVTLDETSFLHANKIVNMADKQAVSAALVASMSNKLRDSMYGKASLPDKNPNVNMVSTAALPDPNPANNFIDNAALPRK